MRTDRSLELLREGYPWGRRLRGTAAAVPSRLLGRAAVVVGGPDGVRRFYDPRLRRSGAFPLPLKLVLFGPGTVHGLDGTEHHERKAMYLRLLTPDAVAGLAERAEREWELAARRWQGRERVVLFDEAVQVLTAAVLPWAGVPHAPRELPRRARQLADVLDGFATPGRAYLRAVVARLRLGRWAKRLVRRTRRQQLHPEPGTALHTAATARDHHGNPLPQRVAATAFLNVVRPTVAVSWFVAFAGKALHEHPEWRSRIAEGDRAALDAFVQEARRCYPFVPVLAARARGKQDVLGFQVPRGGLVVLDVHGTDHDPARWPDPDRFDPDRFLTGTVDKDTLVPQGGGEVDTGHRCPGEDATLAMLAVATRSLARLPLVMPPQDLDFDVSRVPTRPRSGVVFALDRARQ
ncbi:cytochrome P450 [Saccharomonospora marina XMU15]|uniref:Cytochrome P450 n=1 Tax=Saccharomonospora marina XMU15 TaxID=882083 RepID=H5X3D9_9PSEU|nr:cytochrome P450 [Saccharomonospora marina]EHR49873.1 cytochrome P450 [Saccharomonospora marina XMU15]